MNKFTAEEKTATVQSYLEGLSGYTTIGVSVSTIRI